MLQRDPYIKPFFFFTKVFVSKSSELSNKFFQMTFKKILNEHQLYMKQYDRFSIIKIFKKYDSCFHRAQGPYGKSPWKQYGWIKTSVITGGRLSVPQKRWHCLTRHTMEGLSSRRNKDLWKGSIGGESFKNVIEKYNVISTYENQGITSNSLPRVQ